MEKVVDEVGWYVDFRDFLGTFDEKNKYTKSVCLMRIFSNVKKDCVTYRIFE